MCTDGACGRVTKVDGPLCLDFGVGEAAIASAAITSAAGVANASATNATNQAIAGQNTAANAYMQVQNQGYNADQAAIARQFNSEEAAVGRDWSASQAQLAREQQQAQYNRTNEINTGEAQAQRDYQTTMSNTQYQRAIADMKAAGINPMMAVKNGGAGNLTGAAASGASPGGGVAGSASSASGPAASSSGWAGPGKWESVGPIGAQTVGTAISSALAAKDMDVKDAQIRSLDAETASKWGNTPPSAAGISQINKNIESLDADIKATLAKAENYQQDTNVKVATERLTRAQENLTKTQTQVAAGVIPLQQAQKAQTLANTAKTNLESAILKVPATVGDQIGDAAKSAIGGGNIFNKAYEYGRELGKKLHNAW